MKKILIIGATSAIASATARQYAEQGAELYLIGRTTKRLQDIAQDLTLRGAHTVHYAACDLNALDKHEKLINDALNRLGTVDSVLVAHGVLPNQEQCQQQISLMLEVIHTNTLSTLSLLTLLANQLEQQQKGCLAVITSVAGERGRQSNYVYGAAKGMLSIFLQGLRNRLHPAGVHVLDVKPGFVDTPMTKQFKKGVLWSTPERVACDIIRAIDKRKNTLYTPFFWRGIMGVIKLIPECVFKRLKL